METTLTAPDIECDGCANAIKKAVGQMNGIESVTVDVDGKRVTVNHGPQVSRSDIEHALDKAGFPVSD